ncbi:constitutive coactivator of PPAR-gamma-like protein 1 isoform X2 [Anthonomus grandis grandis]|uniref:constitutive coactivator of PPAR-gamma-like protein 1 isoform X2 n=1 Tax=Anthonomus grandis grandis TaxID=2921223 RepID=UPI0021658588|nr:constitutive coactivator of PPAR-gamma-like protein 1 isoform X2 [Anthonomus grandis grandis]
MGIQDLQHFLESDSLEGGSVSVDLLKIARNVSQRQQPHQPNRKIRPMGGVNKLKLIVDAENCLDRLYGGYYSDWACGGQWNRMVQYLSLLCGALEHGNIEIAVVFNGTIEQCRMEEWKAEQAVIRQKVGMVLKHINTKGTPPPKVWWVPPITLRSALRMALRHLGVTVMCTMDDHHQETIAYCREYGFHGLLADDSEYAAFDPPRYFSSEHLKMTYKGSIETKEYMLSVLTKALNITPDQVCVMAALLGNFLLPEAELQDLYKKINLTRKDENSSEQVVKTLAEYVSALPSPSPPANMDALVAAVFGSLEDKRAARFKQSVQYYLNGTHSGFLQYCAPGNLLNYFFVVFICDLSVIAAKDKNERKQKHAEKKEPQPQSPKEENTDLDESGFASETSEQQRETLQNYNMLTAQTVMSSDLAEMDMLIKSADDSPGSSEQAKINGVENGSEPQKESSETPVKIAQKPKILQNNSQATASSAKQVQKSNIVTPSVSADVLRTASLRHQKGLMMPTILHVLSTQEVRMPCLMEDESNREFPPIYDIYLPLRQRVYAVLFNLHHLRYVHSKKKESGELGENAPPPDIIVKEWVYSRSNPYQKPECVKAEPLPWAVPTLQRLWFGPAVDDKRRRMRAFLSCLNSDTPLILNTAYVPQHMLIMACVLRYIMSQDKPIMRRNELDSFLCQAFNPNLMNVQHLQELTPNIVSSRGVQLAALFMQGVEMAILANDACGAPLPWLMCCPWLYFDGKLFHYTLSRSQHAKNILEVCDNYIERVVKVERMRKAILEGLDIKFAKIQPPQFQPGLIRPGMPTAYLPTLPLPSARAAPGLRGRPIPSRGGQLQVAGVVVGSWGANYGFQNNLRQAPQVMPAGMSFRGRGRGFGGGGNVPASYGRGRNQKGGMPSYPVGTKKTQGKKRTNKSNKVKQEKGLALTVKTDNGDVQVNDVIVETNGASSSPTEKPEECANLKTNHKGQGDAPSPVQA